MIHCVRDGTHHFMAEEGSEEKVNELKNAEINRDVF